MSKIKIDWDADNDFYILCYDDSDGSLQRIAFSAAEIEKIKSEIERLEAEL